MNEKINVFKNIFMNNVIRIKYLHLIVRLTFIIIHNEILYDINVISIK